MAGLGPTPPCDAEVFARFQRPRRMWAVAAIHGDAARLRALHQKLAREIETGDCLVYLGGYLGYGPDIVGTLDELITFRRWFLSGAGVFLGDIAFLRGAQEEMWQKLLQLQFAPNPREVLRWMLEHGVGATLAAYGIDIRQGEAAARDGAMSLTRWTTALRTTVDARPGHRQLLTSLRRAAVSADGALLFVHAGIDPGKPLQLQGDVLWWGGANIVELDTPYGGFRRVVRGFDRRHAGLAEGRFAASLDAGCGFGGPLLAGCFAPDAQLLGTIEA